MPSMTSSTILSGSPSMGKRSLKPLGRRDLPAVPLAERAYRVGNWGRWVFGQIGDQNRAEMIRRYIRYQRDQTDQLMWGSLLKSCQAVIQHPKLVFDLLEPSANCCQDESKHNAEQPRQD